VIYGCLQRDPQQRFVDAAQLAQALAPFAWRARGSVERVQSFSDATISQPNMPAQLTYPSYPTNPQAWTDANSKASTTGGSTGPSITSPAGVPRRRSMLAVIIGIPVAFVVAGSILAVFLLTRTKEPPRPTAIAASTPAAVQTTPVVSTAAAAAIPAPPAIEDVVAEKVKDPEAVDAGDKTSHSSKRHRPRGAASASPTPAAVDDSAFDPTKATRK
jgi:hypothetical protein